MHTKGKSAALVGLLIAGFAAAVAVRVVIGGFTAPLVSQSALAGIAFAACLVLLICVKLPATVVSRKNVLLGLVGGLALCIPSIIALLWTDVRHQPMGNYAYWALIVAIVAMAEEMFLRGTLYDALARWRNAGLAIGVSAVLFALLHVPLYGWHVVPLDMVVGLWLGLLRKLSGTYLTPGIAHVIADMLGWWLR